VQAVSSNLKGPFLREASGCIRGVSWGSGERTGRKCLDMLGIQIAQADFRLCGVSRISKHWVGPEVLLKYKED